MNNLIIDKRTAKNGKVSYRYRFETASVGGKRKWVSKSGFRTKAEATKAGNTAMADYLNIGLTDQETEISFADYLDLWIKNDCEVDLKETTVESYRKAVELYMKPYLGGYMLRSIRRENLQDYLMYMFNAGFSKHSMTKLKALLTKSFNYALDNNYIRHNPSVRLRMPKNRDPETPTRCRPHYYLPNDIIIKIFERFPEGTTAHVPLMLAYKCGLRLGETFGLTWQDIDFEDKTLTINRQVQWHADISRTKEEKEADNGTAKSGNSYWFFTNPKHKSYRIIDLDDELIALLKRTKMKQQENARYYNEFYIRYYTDSPLTHDGIKPQREIFSNALKQTRTPYEVDFVCREECGKFTTPRITTHVARKVHYEMNYKEYDFHSLRHTHATMLAENNAPVKYVQTRLGHAKIEITLNIYQHLTKKMSEEGNRILNEIFTGKE